MSHKRILCWDQFDCDKTACPVYGKKKCVCWLTPDTLCHQEIGLPLDHKFEQYCTGCKVYRSAAKKTPHGSLVRMALCLQAVEHLKREGVRSVSSRFLGRTLRTSPTQIRKDFSEFHIASDSGSGYETGILERQLRHTLCLDSPVKAVMIGCGDCAKMLLENPALASRGTVDVTRVFAPSWDPPPDKVAGYKVYAPSGLPEYLNREQIRVALVSTPDPAVKSLFNFLNHSPVQAILNFSPFRPELSPKIKVFSFDLQVKLDVVAFHLRNQDTPVLPENALL